ncbi:MAG: SusD/RagB family nutrient-binding outer membrane lipoprotein, partial [Flavisolibacter sp.]
MRKIILLLSVPLLLLAGCKKYLDVNKNTDAPDYIEAHLYLPGIQQAYEGFYWDIRALGPLTQMMGTTSYTSFANHYYTLGSDAGGEIWRSVYWLQGMNLENLINQSMAAENWTLAGIGYAMKAYSWDIMTKVHGDLPMKQAFVPGRLSHDYDYQDTIYPQVREWAYKAIELLEKPDNTDYGTKITANDYIYGGDKAKWIKFAYAVIVKNLASLTNKTDFKTKYGQELIDAAGKSFESAADDAVVKIAGGSQSAPYSAYNNFWGTARANLSYLYFQHEYAVQVFTGTVPKYDESTGDKYPVTGSQFSPYELADKQIITDTLVNDLGHFDPRVAVKLSTTSNPNFLNLSNTDSVKKYRYFGGSFTSQTGSIGTAPSYYGRNASSTFTGTVNDGIGKWLYRDNAPYILTTAAEIKFCLAEAYWKMDQPAQAFEAFKEGVQADMDFTAKYISPGKDGLPTGGDKITVGAFNTLASAYE